MGVIFIQTTTSTLGDGASVPAVICGSPSPIHPSSLSINMISQDMSVVLLCPLPWQTGCVHESRDLAESLRPNTMLPLGAYKMIVKVRE